MCEVGVLVATSCSEAEQLADTFVRQSIYHGC